MKKFITPQQAVLLMERSKGRIFGVTFTKKNGDTRIMTARKHVTKGVTGKGLKYDPLKKSLMTVFDMQKKAFRMININSLITLSVSGEKYEVIPSNRILMFNLK